MKKILLFFLILVLCLTSAMNINAESISFSEADIMIFLDKLNTCENPAEIKELFSLYSPLAEEAEQYIHYINNPEISEETTIAFFKQRQIFDNLYDFHRSFDENVILARFNTLPYPEYQAILHETKDILNLGSSFYKYMELNSSHKNMVHKELCQHVPFYDTTTLREDFDMIIDNLSHIVRPPVSGGGSGGGNGFESYVLTPQGNIIENEPAINEKIKFVLRAELCTEPKAIYVISVYGTNGIMKTIHVFESSVSEMGSIDEFEFEAQYNSADSIWIYTLSGQQKTKPLREKVYTNFSHFGKSPQ